MTETDQQGAPASDDPGGPDGTDGPIQATETESGLWVEIDQETCIGSGSCVRLAKGAFTLGEDGVAYLADPDATDEKRLRLAERSCPTGAIVVDGGS